MDSDQLASYQKPAYWDSLFYRILKKICVQCADQVEYSTTDICTEW